VREAEHITESPGTPTTPVSLIVIVLDEMDKREINIVIENSYNNHPDGCFLLSNNSLLNDLEFYHLPNIYLISNLAGQIAYECDL